MNEYDGLKKRYLSGYYTPPQDIGRLRLLKPDNGFQFGISSQKITEQGDLFTITAIHVLIGIPGNRMPIGYMDWHIFDSKGNWVSAEDFFWGCDRYTQALCNLARAITQEPQISIEELFDEGTFAELDRIEIREPYLGKGLGAAAIRSFAAKSLVRRRVHTVFMKPFPLQCEIAASELADDPSVHAAYDAYTMKATRSLFRYYRRALGARPLSRRSLYMYVPVSTILGKP